MARSPQRSLGSDFSSDGTDARSVSSRSSSPGQLININVLGLTGCEHTSELWMKCKCGQETRNRPHIPKMPHSHDDGQCYKFVEGIDQCPAKPRALSRSVNLPPELCYTPPPETQNVRNASSRKSTSFDIWLNSVLNDLYAPKDALIIKDHLLGMPQRPDEYQIHIINCLLPQGLGMTFVTYRQTGVFPPKCQRLCLQTS